jgi:hypothetical protein
VSEQEQEVIEQPKADERPDWLPSNFKSPEDLAKSYAAAQAELTQTKQQMKDLQAQQEEILAQQQAQQSTFQQNDIQAQLYEAVASGDPQQELAAMAWLAEQAAQKYAGQQQAQPAPPQNNVEVLAFAANQTLAAKYDDWNEISVDVRQMIEQDPDLLRVDGNTPLAQVVQGLERVYKVAKADRVLSQGESVLQIEQEANRLSKQQAQTITGASQRPQTSTDEEEYWQSVKEQQLGSVRVGRL